MNTKPKLALQSIINDELEKLPQILEEMNPKDRVNFLIKMMQYNDEEKKQKESLSMTDFFKVG